MDNWVDRNPLAFGGIAKARQLLGKIAAEVADENLTEHDVTAFNIEIGKLLRVVTALSEGLNSFNLDDELRKLLKDN